MNVKLDFHEANIRYPNSGAATQITLGDLIVSYLWPCQAVPQVGEIVTVHPGPDLKPSSESRSGKVTGVQHVFDRGHLAVVTIMDGM